MEKNTININYFFKRKQSI